MTTEKIPGYIKMPNRVIQNKTVSPSSKLIYAFILTHENFYTKKAEVSMDSISRGVGYSKHTILDSLRELQARKLLSIAEKNKGRLANQYSITEKTGAYTKILTSFISNVIMKPKEKEFLLLLSIELSASDEIGSFTNPADCFSISRKIGLSSKIVTSRIESLRSKGLLVNATEVLNSSGYATSIGFQFNEHIIPTYRGAESKEFG